MAEEEFERGLHRDIPRGLKGREDNLPRTRWAEPEELLPKDWDYSSASGGLFLGYRKGRMLGWSDDRHALTVAGTRAGKGASLIVPNLLLYPGSVLAIDPKGELARITGRRRKELGNKLVVLDPFGENGRWKSGNYNPLAELDPKGKEVIDEAGAIAQALVVYSGQGDPHWTLGRAGVVAGAHSADADARQERAQSCYGARAAHAHAQDGGGHRNCAEAQEINRAVRHDGGAGGQIRARGVRPGRGVSRHAREGARVGAIGGADADAVPGLPSPARGADEERFQSEGSQAGER